MTTRPADVCRRLLAALDASEGRRRRRKRDTTPDAIGLAIKRRLLESVVREDPGPEAFEEWLLEKALGSGEAGEVAGPLPAGGRRDPAPAPGEDAGRAAGGEDAGREGAPSSASGPIRAMALDILAEWRLAQASPGFRQWLESGAPSDDAAAGNRGPRRTR